MRFEDLKIGDKALAVGYFNNNLPAYQLQLMSLGLVPGTHFEVTKIAPLGDPIEIQFRGYRLSLRRSEGAILKIQAAG